MNRAAAFGVIGGSGRIAKALATELRRSTDKPILIGARNLASAQAFAAGLGAAVSAVQLDVRDARSLEDFCGRSSVVVNCAGPVCELQDRVAQAALRQQAHYIDVAGLTIVRERMMPHHQQAMDLELSYVVSAGWLPGMSEMLPAYSLAVAKSRMHAIQSVIIHFGDSGEWSDNALRDAAWYLRKFGRRRPMYTHNGQWVRAKLSEVLLEDDIGSPVGRCLFSLSSLPEMSELIGQIKDCDVRAYTYLPSRRTAVAGSLIALLPMPMSLALRILRPVLRAPSLPVGGFNVVEVRGRRDSHDVLQRHQVSFERGREYWMTGVVAATIARLISEGQGVKPGAHFLAEAVDPIAFVDELRTAGVTVAASFSPEG